MVTVEMRHMRVWKGVDHAAVLDDAEITEVLIPATAEAALRRGRRAVVDVYRQTEPPSRALLGGSIEPAAGTECRLLIPVTRQPKESAPQVRGAASGELHQGLPAEYVAGVVAGFEATPTPPCTVVIDRAAHHLVDSSMTTFASAARVLAAVLVSGDLPPGEQLEALVQGEE